MSFHTPAGWLDRCMIRDDSAEHQIRLDHKQGRHELAVSCTCRATGQKSGVGPAYEPLAVITTAEQAQEIWSEHLPTDAKEAAS